MAVLACGPRKVRARGRRTRSRVLLGHGGEEGPDGRGPRGSDGERGEAERAGPEGEGGPAAICWAERRKEEKKRERVDRLG